MSVMKGSLTLLMLLASPFPRLPVNRAASSSKKWSICSTREMWRVWRISAPFYFQSTIHRNESRKSFPAQLPTNAAGLVVHALALEGRESTDLRLRAVSRFELVGGVQHKVPQTLARGYQAWEKLRQYGNSSKNLCGRA